MNVELLKYLLGGYAVRKLPLVISLWIVFSVWSSALIFVNAQGSGYIDVYTSRGGKGLNMPSDAFGGGENVTLYAEVWNDSIPVQDKFVTLIILSPSGLHDFSRTIMTNASGVAMTSFQIYWPVQDPEAEVFGEWYVEAKVDVNGQIISDTLTFECGWLIEVISVETGTLVNGTWLPTTNFTRGEYLPARLKVKNIAFIPRNTTLEVTFYDSLDVPCGSACVTHTILGNTIKDIFFKPLQIPKWATLGKATLIANAYEPGTQGRPYCPEKTTVFTILEDSTPPTTVHDYDGLWHRRNFAINLIATDTLPGSGVAETFYKINDGPIKTVSTDGQPFIKTEGADNRLEYWSVDHRGNKEAGHILTGVKLDKTTPKGSITINGGVPYTTSISVTLMLTAADATSGVSQVRYSNDGVWDIEPWEAPLPTKTWTLPHGEGIKIVYYQIKDNAGLVSTFSDTIILDTLEPTGSIRIAEGSTFTNSLSVTLTLSAEDVGSGVAEMRFSQDNITWTPWEVYSISKAWTLTTGDGTKTVFVQFMDNVGFASKIYHDAIILDTAKPTANAGTDQTVNENTLIALNGSASTDENGIASYMWTFTDVAPQTLSGKNPTYTFTTPGAFTVTLEVTDPAGNTAADTVIITVLDITKPTAKAGPDQTVNEDTVVTFDGSGSSDNVDIVRYTWTFTDEGMLQTLHGVNQTYTFETPSTYNVILNVTDDAGNYATDTIVITVLDVTKPVANAGDDQTVNAGATVSFDADASTDNVGIASYEWDFGDGATGTGKTAAHTYANPGTYTVTLTVKDAAGNTATNQITVTVQSAESFPLWIVGATVATVAIAGAATLLLRRRKQPPARDEQN